MLLLIWLSFFIIIPVSDLYFSSNISNKEKNTNPATLKKSCVFKGNSDQESFLRE